jgi:hypothetical protein
VPSLVLVGRPQLWPQQRLDSLSSKVTYEWESLGFFHTLEMFSRKSKRSFHLLYPPLGSLALQIIVQRAAHSSRSSTLVSANTGS